MQPKEHTVYQRFGFTWEAFIEDRDEGSYQLSRVWDKLLHTDDRHRKSVLAKASDVKPKRR